MTIASRAEKIPSRRIRKWLVWSLFVGLSAVFLATGLFFAHSSELERVVRLTENDAIAQGVAASILAREDGHLNVLLSYAGRFRFREAIQRRDRMEALSHLRRRAFRRLARELTDRAAAST